MKLTMNVTVVSKGNQLLRYMLEFRDESGAVVVNAPITDRDADVLAADGVPVVHLKWE